MDLNNDFSNISKHKFSWALNRIGCVYLKVNRWYLNKIRCNKKKYPNNVYTQLLIDQIQKDF